MIEFRGVRKQFPGGAGLKATTLTLAAGRTTAFLGPSGCGKSTLIRLVNGLLWPDEGRVIIGGEPLTPATVTATRLRSGYVVQDGGLFPHLTALGNAGLLPAHLGWERDRVRRRAEELADLTRLPRECLQKYPAQLSGGQRQRVSIMRALMLDPAVLLLDEPMGALDPMIRSGLQADLRSIFRSLGKTVLLVTHDFAEAAFLADDVALMRDGVVLQFGPMRDLVDRPADPFVTEFLNAQRPVDLFKGA